MAFCNKCGAKLEEDSTFCSNCGAPVEAAEHQAAPSDERTKDYEDNKWMAVLAYLGPLVFIPLYARKGSAYAQYHAKQGFNLFIVWVGYCIVDILLNLIKVTTVKEIWGIPVEGTQTPWYISLIIWLLSIAVTVLAIIGIVNALKGKKKKLPIIGEWKLMK